MDSSNVGRLIYKLRKEKNMTQKNLADLMNISDKTISKWERGLGCPDITLLPDLSKILGIRIESILNGIDETNRGSVDNMRKIKFYVCKKCGNIITSTSDLVLECCSRKLKVLEPKKEEDDHVLNIEPVEDEMFITTKHQMVKEHYIGFVAYVKGDSCFLIKQYPEWNLSVRIRKQGRGRLYYYCVNHGLFYKNI
ncbi:MAG: helix-turn-helix domain-containing protein [Clostridium sp.]|uniref:helix-turn-helix domain-containing protein n=1 Tax=Clostridium sp. TaxID=1506 RepID=UPI002FCA7BC0